MEAIGAIVNVILFIFIIYLISRVAHFFNNTRNKLNEIDTKLDEIKKEISGRD